MTNLSRQERTMLGVGLAIWGTLFTGIALISAAHPSQGRALWAGLVAELLTGREGGVPVGLAAGAHPLLLWPVSFLQDFGTAFVGYVLFHALLRRYQDRDIYVMRRLRRIEGKARANQAFVARWGPAGIAAFMLVPFLVNGPFVGLVLGRLTGIPTHKLLAPVILTTIAIAAAWVFALDAMLGLLERVDPRLGWWAAGVTVVIVVTLGVVDFLRENRALVTSEEE